MMLAPTAPASEQGNDRKKNLRRGGRFRATYIGGIPLSCNKTGGHGAGWFDVEGKSPLGSKGAKWFMASWLGSRDGSKARQEERC